MSWLSHCLKGIKAISSKATIAIGLKTLTALGSKATIATGLKALTALGSKATIATGLKTLTALGSKATIAIGLKTLTAFVLLGLSACEHRPLVEMGNTHYIRVYINEHIKNVTEGFYDTTLKRPEFKRPNVLRVMLCDKASGRMVAERYLQHTGEDEKGYYLDGHIIAPYGDYELMVYNFGTESTLLRNETSINEIEAYTNPISPMLYGKIPSVRTEIERKNIVYEPDHLFVITEPDVHIAPKNHIDTLTTASHDYFKAETIVKSYYIQVRVKGIQWVRSSTGLLTGISRSKNLKTRKFNPIDPAVLYFEMLDGKRQKVKTDNDVMDETAVLYATFNTFGRIPDQESVFEVTFDFIKSDGTPQTETITVTPLFDSPEGKEKQWIIIDKEIKIDPPKSQGGGGFSPGVDEWEDEESDIII